jgi:hypothetical protein
MKKLRKNIIIAMISGSVLFAQPSFANNNNNYSPTSLMTISHNNKILTVDSSTTTENVQGSVNQGANNAKEFMSKLTAEISALFSKYGNSGYPLLNKAVQVIKIVLTYVLRTIEDILVLIHDLLKVVTN